MRQTWRLLLFAHWRVDPRALRAKVPSQFALDTYEGAAWVGVVPFLMTNVAPRGVPALPGISSFPELNVRTYVRVGDKPGVWFFSLDAGSRLAVGTARLWLNLPYFRAAMEIDVEGNEVRYGSRRLQAAPAEFRAAYWPVGPAAPARAGSLDHFLTERYCLYNLDKRGRPYRLEIHHPPWPLRAAEARINLNSMAAAAGIVLPNEPPRLHFAERLDMVTWMPKSLRL